MNERIAHIMEILKQKPYRVLIYPLSTVYLIAVLSIYTYMYNGNPFLFYRSFPQYYTITASILNIIISILLGVSITLFIAKIKEIHFKSAGLGVTGLLFGSLAAGCPGCFFGLFPVILGFFGVTGTLAILPLNGLEFQIATVFLMLLSVYFLSKETDVACKIPKK